MSAGTGIAHSEHNREKVVAKIFQIWIIPDRLGGRPSWGARPFPKEERDGRFVTLASGLEEDGDALPIRTGARVAGASLQAGQSADYRLGEGRRAYLVPAAGMIDVNGTRVHARDGVAIDALDTIRVKAVEDSEIVLVDVA
jgi:redox-sensitive bicupin YhaK (pirin superfamily)